MKILVWLAVILTAFCLVQSWQGRLRALGWLFLHLYSLFLGYGS
ncbi:hypothetical protein ACSKKH_05100 [Limosilactobacillus reuteri]